MAEISRVADEPDFFLVWNPNGGPPRYRHHLVDNARAEAKRLARLSPGQQYYILHAIARAMVPEPPVEMIELKVDDGDLPF